LRRLTASPVDVIETYRADVLDFVRRGKSPFVWVCILSLPFPVMRALMAYFSLRFLGIDGSDFRHIFEAQLILILLEFFAPSPGGAGVMEVASSAVMVELMPAGHAPSYNLLWRSTTLYVPAVAGFVSLGVTFLRHQPSSDTVDGRLAL
jgi:uncharacterized membrane protein YbhN (UPF0104 family)